QFAGEMAADKPPGSCYPNGHGYSSNQTGKGELQGCPGRPRVQSDAQSQSERSCYQSHARNRSRTAGAVIESTPSTVRIKGNRVGNLHFRSPLPSSCAVPEKLQLKRRGRESLYQVPDHLPVEYLKPVQIFMFPIWDCDQALPTRGQQAPEFSNRIDKAIR